jgi:SAM-dependent methyltransferase
MYPMGSDQSEQSRLDAQLGLLWDSHINHYIAQAKTALELGCGIGTNVQKLLALNPKVKYTGIDISEEFIGISKSRYPNLNDSIQFIQGDVTTNIGLNQKFDLVFIRLVLWCVGESWTRVLAQAKTYLNPGGYILIFEPDDQMLFFSPPLPNFESLIQKWQIKVKKRGQNPMIGREVYAELIKNDFEIMHAKVLSNLALSINPEHLKNTAKNLEKIFCGNLLTEPNLDLANNMNMFAQNARAEILACEKINLIHDGYFSYVGMLK